mgnify:CR=1 FL=1
MDRALAAAFAPRARRLLRQMRLGLLGEPFDGPLPERARLALLEAQKEGEIVVGWVQAFIVLVWAALYLAAPKTAPMNAPIQPVPLTLATYGAFVLFRLVLAHRHKLTRPILALSIVMDIGVLMLTIWCFHLEYRQPPAFYLKAPTLLYVFIFISLRALSFEAVWVVLAGGAAAAGWIVLVAYAALSDPSGMPITHNYVRYMTSSTILIGAEVDKIISILMVTLVLAIALTRVRGVLVRSLVGRLVVDDLSRFVARDVAERIVTADDAVQPGQGELRQAAALFIDLRGFTGLAQALPPGELMALLGEYQMRLVPVVQEHGGAVDKYLGDGIRASFGATRASPTFAADALRAADALAAAAQAWRLSRLEAGKPAPRVGLAVAAGPVIFGAVGDASRLEYTVIGDAVNLAAKLEKHTKVEAVMALATVSVLALALEQGYHPAGGQEVRRGRLVEGVAERLDLVVLAP